MLKKVIAGVALILGTSFAVAQQNPMNTFNNQAGPIQVTPFWAFGAPADHRLPINPFGGAPTLTAGCNGAGSVVDPLSTDTSGLITGQTSAATTCTLTFANAYATAPYCVTSGNSSAILTTVASTTTLVTTFASTANYKFYYICFGK